MKRSGAERKEGISIDFIYKNAREVIARVNMVESVIKRTAAGEKPVVEFQISPEFTKRITLLLYRWILLSHLYLYYRGVQEELKIDNRLNQKDVTDIVTKKEIEKTIRRYY